jgi:NTP pyrophosphatase (non-canonical NTP hydrolase)
MESKEYKKQALRTNTPDIEGVSQRILNGFSKDSKKVINLTVTHEKAKAKIDLLHASMGLVTEAGEFQDALKKHFFYGKELDLVNLKEEIGDCLWYCAVALDALGTDFEAVMQTNINKLNARYPEKFSEDQAINRDVAAEREILKK